MRGKGKIFLLGKVLMFDSLDLLFFLRSSSTREAFSSDGLFRLTRREFICRILVLAAVAGGSSSGRSLPSTAEENGVQGRGWETLGVSLIGKLEEPCSLSKQVGGGGVEIRIGEVERLFWAG